MFHNPKALHPVDHEMFPGIAHHWLDDGHIRSLIPEFHPYSSLTWNMLAIDGMPGQQSQPKSPAAP
jgi:hypothetical protein